MKLDPDRLSLLSTPCPFEFLSASTPPDGIAIAPLALLLVALEPSTSVLVGGEEAPKPEIIDAIPPPGPGPADMEAALRVLLHDLDLRSSRSPNSNESWCSCSCSSPP